MDRRGVSEGVPFDRKMGANNPTTPPARVDDEPLGGHRRLFGNGFVQID